MNDVPAAYIDELTAALPRLLAFFDRDEASASWGIGDRRHWAWGLSDFSNGTFQGAANGLARLLAHDLLPSGFSHEAILERIHAMFVGADRIRRRDGSLEEAFPFEGSYCVTALVAYDLLTAIELLGSRLDSADRDAKLAVVRPMIRFLEVADETHAIISNHLATAVAALFKWNQLTGAGGIARARQLLDRILAHQSHEGWYCEYGGADPGYQTLCTYYLADVLRMTGDARLRESLAQSVRFLWHFAHPDGSFGGLYGSRNTRFYYPAGLEYLAAQLPEAAALAAAMRVSIAGQRVVTLASMDEPNIIPMFNAYCWAAAIAGNIDKPLELPCRNQPFRQHWKHAGLLVDRGSDHYTIIGTRKGGVVYHYPRDLPPQFDAGLLFCAANGARYSTQHFASREMATVDGDDLIVESELRPVTRKLPAPWQFIVLRLLNLTVMRNMRLREWVKQLLVRMLITGYQQGRGRNIRRIHLGSRLAIEDDTDAPESFSRLNPKRPFVAIHMASQGYWQAQDDA